MANNFIPWLGSDATTSPQQPNYGKIAKTGFEAGGFVKAEDFNAALRMTTLVCAGIASAFGFNNNSIDVSEETITKAIQGAKITLGEITASKVISSYVSTYILSATEIKASERISGQSLTILNVERISAGGTITGTVYKIGNDTVIDDNKNISGASLAIGNNVATISAAGDISGTSYTAGNLKVIDKDGNISGERVTAKKITSTGAVTANSLDINGRGISSQGVITGDSLVVNSLETIDSSRNIKNVGSITASNIITTNSNISGNNITATGDLTGNNITASGSITGNLIITGGINGTYMHIGPNIATTNLTISSDGKLTANSNISAGGYVNSTGSIKTNSIERITSAGVMLPSKLNLKNILNCAYLESGGDAVITIREGEGTTGDYIHFGAKIPELTYSTDEAQKQILLACISIEATGESTHAFNSVYTTILTGYPNSNQGSATFNIYSGDGTSIGESWGQIRLSYQPYSWFSTSNPVAPSCYLAYKKNLSFNDIITTIRVDLYPIAAFN